mgnify:CR=1 FL=1
MGVNMYSIGEFARLLGINSKTLRYYDMIDLLKPSYVDNYTGYRYYSKDDIEEYKRILYLKGLGFTLDEIKENLTKLKLDSISKKKQELIKEREKISWQINELTNLENTLTSCKMEEKTLIKK